LRVLDMSNESEDEIVAQIARLILELRRAGYSTMTLMKVMWRAEKEAWVDLRSVRKLTRLSPAKAGVLANCDDEMMKAWRMAARLRK
jgi:hypothetical protein